MTNIRSEDTIHKSNLNRLLIEIIDSPALSQQLAFKGGTCAAMLGYLDRFSVDLDFDLIGKNINTQVREEFYRIFDKLKLTITKKMDDALFFQLRYPSEPGKRNTIKVSATDILINSNEYKFQYFTEIDRVMNCQTIETMFANKLVTPIDRYTLHQTVAGRDIYDIHHFFVHGYSYLTKVIQERTNLDPKSFFSDLIEFIQKHITQKVVNEDLDMLLPDSTFQQIRNVLLPETLHMLSEEQKGLTRAR